MKVYEPLLEKFKQKEVKMGNENLEQRVQELEQAEELKTQVLEKLVEKADQHQATLNDLKNSLGEPATNPLDEGEIEHKGFERGLEGVASGFENNELIGELEPIAQRIFKAIQSQGYDIVPQEKQAEEVGEAETEAIETELPIPPYLHIISLEAREKLPEEERKNYFGWADNKFARLVEA